MGESPAETDPERSRRSRRRRRRLWITFAFVVGVLVAAEVLVRVVVPAGRLVRFAQLDEALAGSDRAQFMGTIENDPETFWRFAPDVQLQPGLRKPFFGRISNEQGLREQARIPVPKPEDELRILFLGDSCTFGYLLDESQSYVARTEAKLRGRFPDRKIECINGGVPGYTAFQCWRKLVTEGFRYEPDLVVLQSGWNERVEWDGRSDLEHYEALRASRPPAFLAPSRLCQLLWTWARWPGPREGKTKRMSVAEYRDVVARIAAASEEKQVDLLLLITGSRQNVRSRGQTELQKIQFDFGGERKWPDGGEAYVDGVRELDRLVFDEKQPVETLLFDEAHPTLRYSEVLADALVRKITPWILAR